MSSHRTGRTAQARMGQSEPKQQGACIEVARGNDMIIHCAPEEWPSFVRAVKAGELDDLAKLTSNRKNAVQRPTNGHSESVREKSAPKNWLDLADRILIRATSSWRSCLMHLSFLAAAFAGPWTPSPCCDGRVPMGRGDGQCRRRSCGRRYSICPQSRQQTS